MCISNLRTCYKKFGLFDYIKLAKDGRMKVARNTADNNKLISMVTYLRDDKDQTDLERHVSFG